MGRGCSRKWRSKLAIRRRAHPKSEGRVILIGPIPLTATGKIDKKVIRERYRDQLIEAQPQVR
jgi:acyl-CoA synthetase (AMP-forming)/AMP-acid ligase II